MINDTDRGLRGGSAEGDWVRRMAARPLDGPPLPDAQVVWWKARTLRRFDADARRSAAVDQIETGVACAAAVALLVYLFASGGSAVLPPSLVLPVASSIVLLVMGVAIVSRSTRRVFRQ